MRLPPHALATLAFRRWCWSHSTAVFHGPKLRALRGLLAELPTFCC